LNSLGLFAFVAITGDYVLRICLKSKYGAWNEIENLTLLIQFRNSGRVFTNDACICLDFFGWCTPVSECMFQQSSTYSILTWKIARIAAVGAWSCCRIFLCCVFPITLYRLMVFVISAVMLTFKHSIQKSLFQLLVF
jgi:hypothetical protein